VGKEGMEWPMVRWIFWMDSRAPSI